MPSPADATRTGDDTGPVKSPGEKPTSIPVGNDIGNSCNAQEAGKSPSNSSRVVEKSEYSAGGVELEWDGPNDPKNPLNWPLSKRAMQVICVALITLLKFVSLAFFCFTAFLSHL
jgi:hypothetical protein